MEKLTISNTGKVGQGSKKDRGQWYLYLDLIWFLTGKSITGPPPCSPSCSTPERNARATARRKTTPWPEVSYSMGNKPVLHSQWSHCEIHSIRLKSKRVFLLLQHRHKRKLFRICVLIWELSFLLKLCLSVYLALKNQTFPLVRRKQQKELNAEEHSLRALWTQWGTPTWG